MYTTNPTYSTCCEPNYLTTCGQGHDLHVRDRADIYTGSYISGGQGYEAPGGQTGSNAGIYMVGSHNQW